MNKYILIFLLIPSLCFSGGIVQTNYDKCEVFRVNDHCILKCSPKSENGGPVLLEIPNSGSCNNY